MSQDQAKFDLCNLFMLQTDWCSLYVLEHIILQAFYHSLHQDNVVGKMLKAWKPTVT